MERERLRREREGISLRRITPDQATLRKWALVLPPGKDQIFLPKGFSPAAAHGLPLERLSSRPEKHWGLTERSWFGYLAGRCAYRIVLAGGKIEKLPAHQRLELLKAQVKMKNPAVVPSRLLPRAIRQPGRHTWLTAEFFRRLRPKDKIAALKAWDKAGGLTGIYPRLPISSLPTAAKKIMRGRKLLRLINTFAPDSGPNCFAAAAYSISGRSLSEWMHSGPFFRIALRAGFSPAERKPLPGDLLVCRQKGEAVHAALYLGGYVFEKPGQDLYEPYRLARWSQWRKDWGHTRFQVWAKQ